VAESRNQRLARFGVQRDQNGVDTRLRWLCARHEEFPRVITRRVRCALRKCSDYRQAVRQSGEWWLEVNIEMQ
jgi:hypothetical protein